MKRPVALALIILFAASAHVAYAQGTAADVPAAEALFVEGRRLLDAGKAAEACPKLEESQRLDPGVGTRFFLAVCYEQIGRTASAWAAFREVEAASRTAGRHDREELAKKRADALEPRLVRLQLEVPWAARASNVEIRRNGVVVGAAQWGMPVPIDPGASVFHVDARGKVAIDIRVDAKEEGKTKVVAIPELADAPAPPAEAPPETAPSPLRTIGWATAGVGAAGVVTSGVIGLIAKSKFDDSRSSCTANGDCTSQSDVTGRHDALSLANVGTVVFVSSLVVVAAGVVMIVVAPKRTTASLSFDRASVGGRF
ncbi:MAG TPA: hypothetical protein VIF62_09350 [Labilithrix sp.]|jgi:hypothetical protein